jgi:hypothetical protein
MSDVNPLADLSDGAVIAEHSQHPADNHYRSEMLRRHKKGSADLGDKIWWLNRWLLAFTIAICALTIVLVLVELGVMRRPHEQATRGAWVLWAWNQTVGQRIPLDAFTTGKACRADLLKFNEPMADPLLSCLPDSVDPRGPKGQR